MPKIDVKRAREALRRGSWTTPPQSPSVEPSRSSSSRVERTSFAPLAIVLLLCLGIAVIWRLVVVAGSLVQSQQKVTNSIANQTSSPIQRNLHSEAMSRAQSAFELKQWDGAYAASLEALRIQPTSHAAASLRNLVLSEIRKDKQYFGAQFQKLRSFRDTQSTIHNMEFNEDGSLLTTRHADAIARTWNFSAGTLVNTRQLSTRVFSKDLDLRFGFERRSMDGTQIARVKQALGFSYDITIVDSSTGAQVLKRNVEAEFVEISPDLKTIVTVWGWLLYGAKMEFIDVATGREIRHVDIDGSGHWIPRFAPNGNWLAIGRRDGVVDVWGVAGRSQDLASESTRTRPSREPEDLKAEASPLPIPGRLNDTRRFAEVVPTIAPPKPNTPPNFPGERYPVTRNRILTSDELQSWSTDKLQYAINEMYARHGADFRDTVIRRQFDRFQWYRPKPGTTYDEAEASFSSIETDNVKLLASFRDARAANPNSSTGPSDTIANAKMFEGTWSGMVYTEVRAVSTRTYQDDCTVEIGPDETWIVVTSGSKRAQAKVSRRGRSLFWTVTETTNTFAGPAKSRHSGSFTVSDDGWTAEYRGLGEAISGGPGPSKSTQFGTLRKLH